MCQEARKSRSRQRYCQRPDWSTDLNMKHIKKCVARLLRHNSGLGITGGIKWRALSSLGKFGLGNNSKPSNTS